VTTRCEVVILGAGPYGLAAGAHLRSIPGFDLRVFGEPMEFWKSHMREGMFLRSPWEASHILDPRTALTMEVYPSELGAQISTPVPLDRFVA
jgi:cation diffusion facilitator CzcD-associated flavoprotein CzcO